MGDVDHHMIDGDWNGLRQIEPTLPTEFYYGPAHHERELQGIWYRNWIYLCRADAVPDPRSFRTFEIGSQSVLLLRDENSELRAFFNTCRHRGSVLCGKTEGRLRAKTITCPYHGWTYDLCGNLNHVPTHGRRQPVDVRDFPLYHIAVREWNGFVFVNLSSESQPPLESSIDPGPDTLAHWPLADLRVGHTLTTTIQCNWKVFWENYNECLHCPNVHPTLSRLVPIYRRGIMGERDDPHWQKHADSDDPRFNGGLRVGAATWSSDGKASKYVFPGLSKQERKVCYHFVTALPSLYLVGHVDYVRAVRLRPVSAETTELQAQWLFPGEALADATFDVRKSVEFSARVMAEDASVCELAQRGLHSIRHTNGVLLPEEYEVHRFHNWIRAELALGNDNKA